MQIINSANFYVKYPLKPYAEIQTGLLPPSQRQSVWNHFTFKGFITQPPVCVYSEWTQLHCIQLIGKRQRVKEPRQQQCVWLICFLNRNPGKKLVSLTGWWPWWVSWMALLLPLIVNDQKVIIASATEVNHQQQHSYLSWVHCDVRVDGI